MLLLIFSKHASKTLSFILMLQGHGFNPLSGHKSSPSSLWTISALVVQHTCLSVHEFSIFYPKQQNHSGNLDLFYMLNSRKKSPLIAELYSRARAYCACSRCGRGLFGHFFSHLSFLSSFSLSLGGGSI